MRRDDVRGDRGQLPRGVCAEKREQAGVPVPARRVLPGRDIPARSADTGARIVPRARAHRRSPGRAAPHLRLLHRHGPNGSLQRFHTAQHGDKVDAQDARVRRGEGGFVRADEGRLGGDRGRGREGRGRVTDGGGRDQRDQPLRRQPGAPELLIGASRVPHNT
mgnify:CR=1 FL=1